MSVKIFNKLPKYTVDALESKNPSTRKLKKNLIDQTSFSVN